MDPITPELVSFEAEVRALDAWVAGAFAIPIEARHPQHEAILDKCAGLVIWLDTRREPIPVCLPVIAKVMPLMPALDGPDAGRREERERIEVAFKLMMEPTPTA